MIPLGITCQQSSVQSCSDHLSPFLWAEASFAFYAFLRFTSSFPPWGLRMDLEYSSSTCSFLHSSLFGCLHLNKTFSDYPSQQVSPPWGSWVTAPIFSSFIAWPIICNYTLLICSLVQCLYPAAQSVLFTNVHSNPSMVPGAG